MIEIRVVLDVSDGLRALIAALLGAVDTRRVGGASPPEHGAPGPSPAAVAGATAPPVPSVPLPSPAVAKVRAGKPAVADWRTPERKAVMLAKWSGHLSLLLAALAAVPGPPMPKGKSGVLRWGAVLELGPRPKLPRADAGRVREVAVDGAARGTGGGYRSAERLAVLAREYTAGTRTRDIVAVLNAMPGPAVPANAVSLWAREKGLSRPEGWDWRNPATREGAAPVPPVMPPADVVAAPSGGAGVKVVDGVAWGEILAWADTVDPDLVLRGTPEARLAQINELRRLEGLPVYRVPLMPAPMRAPAAAQVAA